MGGQGGLNPKTFCDNGGGGGGARGLKSKNPSVIMGVFSNQHRISFTVIQLMEAQ